MKPLHHLLTAVLCTATCMTFTQCAGESHNIFNTDVNGADAYIRLDLSVEGTRADVDNEAIVKVFDVYIFNENSVLEKGPVPFSKSSDTREAIVETTSGLKTIYVVAGMHTTDRFEGSVTPGTTTIDEFESLAFSSNRGALINDNGFLMIGKSRPTQIIKSSQTDIPLSNKISVPLVRTMAKATMNFQSMEALGLNFTGAQFAVAQTADKMTVKESPAAVTKAEGQSTYSGLSTAKTGDTNPTMVYYPASSPLYMAENIASSHVSGNTTFISIALTATPKTAYSCAAGSNPELIENPIMTSTFYAVGLEYSAVGTVVYATTSDNAPYYFNDSEQASNYAAKLNADLGLTDPAKQYKAITFTEGKVYYRVNIDTPEDYDTDDYGTHSVLRNKLYNLTIKSVNRLGSGNEDLLFPSEPDTKLDMTSAFIDAIFTVVPWDEFEQDINLE